MTLLPIQLLLQRNGWQVHNLNYPVDTLPFDKTLDYVCDEILKYVNQEDPIVLIGQSMGGVVSNNLHTRELNVQHIITIGSPLHGENLLNQMEAILPEVVVNTFNKLPYDCQGLMTRY